MAYAPEYEVIEPQELEPDIPGNRLPRQYHRVGKTGHMVIDPERDIPARRIPMAQVAVFVCQRRAESILFEIVQQTYAEDQNAVRPVLGPLFHAPSFVDGQFRP